MRVIGFSGPAGAGKDTAVNYLVNNYGYKRVSFADALYKEAAQAFNVSVEFLGIRETKEVVSELLHISNCRNADFIDIARTAGISEFSPRRLLQLWGTEFRRASDNRYWIRQVEELIADKNSKFAISDVRFDDEADLVITNKGVNFKITRDVEAVAAHASEKGISEDYITYVIENTGSVDDLYAKLDDIVLKNYDTNYRYVQRADFVSEASILKSIIDGIKFSDYAHCDFVRVQKVGADSQTVLLSVQRCHRQHSATADFSHSVRVRDVTSDDIKTMMRWSKQAHCAARIQNLKIFN